MCESEFSLGGGWMSRFHLRCTSLRVDGDGNQHWAEEGHMFHSTHLVFFHISHLNTLHRLRLSEHGWLSVSDFWIVDIHTARLSFASPLCSCVTMWWIFRCWMLTVNEWRYYTFHRDTTNVEWGNKQSSNSSTTDDGNLLYYAIASLTSPQKSCTNMWRVEFCGFSTHNSDRFFVLFTKSFSLLLDEDFHHFLV